MNIRKFIITSLAVVCSLGASAQRISFEKQTITTKNALWKHPVTAVFKFTNKDKNPLVIKSVDAGCGCLTPKWTQGTIEKGETGEVIVTYDAKLLGRFDRIIEVFTNAGDKPVNLRMKGLVSVGETKSTSFEEDYPYSIDNLFLSTSNVEFEEVTNRDSTTATLSIYNGTNETYTPTLMHLPSYITAKAEPEVLPRGRKGIITLTLHGDKLNDLGLNQTNIYLSRFPGDKVGTDNDINVSAVLLPDISMQKRSSQHPHFEISNNELYLGPIGNKKKLKGTIKITNSGNSRLNIDRIQAFNPGIMVSLPKSELFPGESVKMTITVQAKFLGMSKAQPRVLFITNDPDHQKEVITVKFE